MAMRKVGVQRRALNVVNAVNDSEASDFACKWTLRKLLSDLLDPNLTVNLTVLHVLNRDDEEPYHLLEDLYSEKKEKAERLLEEFVNWCKEMVDDGGVKIVATRSRLAVGKDPKQTICDVVEELGADILVMGSDGHCAFIRAIKGSVSEYCTRNAACPVIVITKEKYSSLLDDPVFISRNIKSD